MSDLEPEPAAPPSAFRTAPERLGGRYALGELIGTGASAWVYRAHDERLDREVAVKLYPPGVAGPDRARQQQELSVLSQLRHANLVELLDAGEDEGRAYLVMQLIGDPTLADRLVLGGPMGPGEVARLGAELGEALAYVHGRGITHRDIKPANVMVGDRTMLADFGIARLVDAARVTQTGYLIGTLAYLAPEQVSGGDVGRPADVYALGLTLLEALTGSREYDGDGPETAFARLSRAPSVPDGPPVLTELIRAMTALDPTARPSAAEVAQQLEGVDADLGSVMPGQWPLSPVRSGQGGSGTRELEIVAEPAGLGSGSKLLLASQTRHARRRRLLAGALGATGLAAATVGFLTMQGTSAGVAVPAMSVPTPQIGAPGAAVAPPVAQLPAAPRTAAVSRSGATDVSELNHGPAGGGSTSPGPATTDSHNTDPGNKEAKHSGGRSDRSKPSGGSSSGEGQSSGGSSGDDDSAGGDSDNGGSSGNTSSDGGSSDGGSDAGSGGGSTDHGGSGAGSGSTGKK